MKLPRLFKAKAKAPALPPADWVDHAAIAALQAQAQAALAINEPLQRLVAMKAATAAITEKLNINGDGSDLQKLLTAEGQAALARFETERGKFFDVAPVFVLGGSLTGTLGAMCTAAAISAAPMAIAAATLCLPVFFGGSIALTAVYGSKRYRDTATPVLVSHFSPLLDTCARLDAAVAELETNLSLEESRQSAHFDAALAASPSLKNRFTQEAGTAALRGDATAPVEKRIVKKTTLNKPL